MMAQFAIVKNGAVVSIGIVADGKIDGQTVKIYPVGAVPVSDAEYMTLQDDVPDESVIAKILARGAV